MRFITAAILIILPITFAYGKTIDVRSGEHEKFSRLVFMFPQPVPWSIEEGKGQAKLIIDRKDIDYDFSKVFYYIPREKIKKIEQEPGSSNILIHLDENIGITAFTLDTGAIVIDAIRAEETRNRTAEMKNLQDFNITKLQQKKINQEIYWEKNLARTNIENHGFGETKNIRNIQEVEDEILKSLSRAAAQGLLRIDTTEKITQEHEEEDKPPEQETIKKNDYLAVYAETAIDRDSQIAKEERQLDPYGFCWTDEDLALRSWSDQENPFSTISRLRKYIVDDIDNDSNKEIILLSKAYLSIGYGAEAISIIKNKQISEKDYNIIISLANLIDDTEEKTSSLKNMSSCNSAAALWSVISEENETEQEWNISAIKRTFSDLPVTIKKSIKDRLIEKLSKHDPNAIQEIKYSLERSKINGMKKNKGNDYQYIDNTVESLKNSTNDKDIEIDNNTIEEAKSLIYELKNTKESDKIKLPLIKALAESSQYQQAFNEIQSIEEDKKGEALSEIFNTLKERKNENEAITFYFKNRAAILEINPTMQIRNYIRKILLNASLEDVAL